MEVDPCQAWAGVGHADGQSCPSSCPGDQEAIRTGTSPGCAGPAGQVRPERFADLQFKDQHLTLLSLILNLQVASHTPGNPCPSRGW